MGECVYGRVYIAYFIPFGQAADKLDNLRAHQINYTHLKNFWPFSLALHIYYYLFFFVCVLSSSSQFHFVSFVGPSFCVILADMTWTVVYLLFLCASFFFWLLFILFISLTHANMFVCVCVCVCESGHALTHTHLYVLYFIVNCLWHLFRNCFPLFCHFICSAGASVPAFVHLFIYLISFYFMTIFRTYHINCFCFLHFFKKTRTPIATNRKIPNWNPI